MKKLAFLVLLFTACGPAMTTFEYIPVIATTTVPSVPTYVGCYTDTGTRALPNQIPLSGVTVETCTQAAKSAGYKYAGLQYGTQCFAGNVLGFYKDAETACNYGCVANYTQWCGGTWHNSVWQVLP